MYVKCHAEALSYNHCSGGKAVNITYSKCVSVAITIQYAMRRCHIVNCGHSGPTAFFHIISQTARYSLAKKCY